MNVEIINAALKEIGVSEIRGRHHEARILQYFEAIGKGWVRDDETAWCAAFVNFILSECDYKGTGELNARSFMSLGHDTKTPSMGDIVVFWRESKDSWKAHVAFFIREDATHIYCLGGNQSNKVSIAKYPKYKLLSYRRI